MPQVDYAEVSEQPEVRGISVIDLASKMQAGEVVLIDVRDPEEFAAGRIAGALNAPLTDFNPLMIPREQRRETIFYCRTGRRSAKAAEKMAQEYGGVVRHLDGGIEAWIDAGQVTTSQAAAPEQPETDDT